MPLYEYQCQQCNERHEILQSFSDAPIEQCPKCGGSMKKLISSPAIQFKGSGFYKTDYPSSSAGAAAGTKTSTESKADAKTETKSETAKSETKSESKSESTKSESKASE